jgi:formamidopyrimidine-DNA glycosylase
MPELPDLEYVVDRLRHEVVGARIDSARVAEPILLRVTIPGNFKDLCVGKTISAVARRGPFIRLSLGELDIVVHPMLAGRFALRPAEAKTERALGFALGLGERELRYLDDRKMGKAYLVPAGEAAAIPGLASQGVDVLAPEFTLERFRKLAERRRDQVRAFLMDQRALSAIGNAYADEILHRARLHPKTRCSQLGPDELATLYRAISEVLSGAIGEIARRAPPLEDKLRDFLSVRGRKGQPCPDCGTTIRAVRVLAGDACFCPRCQPARRPQFIEWGGLKR